MVRPFDALISWKASQLNGQRWTGSQFFITTRPTPQYVSTPNSNDAFNPLTPTAPAYSLDDKHVVFGKVIAGRSTVRLIEETPTDKDNPLEEVTILDCGELAEGEDMGIEPAVVDETGDKYEEHPSDEEEDVHDPEVAFKIGEALKVGSRCAFE